MQSLLDRVTSWKSTGMGLVAAGVAMYMFNSLGCKAPADWNLWLMGLVAALPGILAKEK